MPSNKHNELKELIRCSHLMPILTTIYSVDPDLWLGGGAIRNLVWDTMHNKSTDSNQDYDIVYYNKQDTSTGAELVYYNALMTINSSINWDVSNQCKHTDCINIYDACDRWFDKSSCVMVRLTSDGVIKLYHSYSLDYLFNCIAEYNPRNPVNYYQLIKSKGWKDKYPLLTLR